MIGQSPPGQRASPSHYQKLLRDAMETMPFDRVMLAAFAELVQVDGGGPVADLGCGPGRITTHLHSLGLSVFGIDLSPEMIAVDVAHPGLRFDEGLMNGLDLADGALGGVVAWYSIIHTPPHLLPGVLAEFNRVLAPGGHLLLAFKAGDERRHLEHAYGHDLSLDVYWLPPDRVAKWSTQVGLVEVARLLREPDETENGRQSYLLARKPA